MKLNNGIYFTNLPEVLHTDQSGIKEVIISIAENRTLKTGNIHFEFTDDESLLQINRDFLNHDYYTDIITFDETIGKTINGEIFISTERVADNANKLNVSFVNECLRVIFHGVLHLAGYDDHSESDQKIMREQENHYLKQFYVSRETKTSK